MTGQSHSTVIPDARRPATVGIFLFDDVEVLDFAGPYEVFSVAARIARPVAGLQKTPFSVVTIAEKREPVIARHGLQVVPDHGFDSAPPLDVLIVPGGVVDAPLSSPVMLEWLRCAVSRAALTASICTGAFLLARIGLLDGRTATTHWEDIAEMRRSFPDVEIVEDVPWVDQGNIVTSAGISAGINMCLHLVRRLVGPELADLTARQMQYDWRSEDTTRDR